MLVAFHKQHRKGWVGIIDALNRWWTKGPYTHTELVFSDGMWYSSTVQEGGCRFRRMPLDNDKWDFIEVPATYVEEMNCREWCGNRCTYQGRQRGYDFLGVALSVILPMDIQDKVRDFCNETVDKALQWIGKLKPHKANGMNPNTFFKYLIGLGFKKVEA